MGFRAGLRAVSIALILALVTAPGFVIADEPTATIAPPSADNPPPTDELAKPVPDMDGKNWADLLSQLFADIAASDTANVAAVATEMNDVRAIGVGDDSWNFCGEKIELTGFDAQVVRLGDKRRWVVTMDMEDECVGLLALFDEAGKLVDAVNVRGDQHISFPANYGRPLGADGALAIVHNWHDNSSQSYDTDSLILVKPEGFSSIGNVWAFGSRGCRDQFTEDAKIRLVPSQPMARIEIAVTRRSVKYAKDCETKIGREVATTFNGSWRWDTKKKAYEAHTKELNLLADWNEKRF